MKVLIAVSCLLAVASAGFIGHTAYTYPYVAAHPVAYTTYAGLQHLPVIGANGVPVDEPAVQHARAEHAAAHAKAAAHSGDSDVVVEAHNVVADGHSVYTGPQHIPVIGPNGVPVDEPAVQHARAEHAAAHVKAAAHSGEVAVVAAPVVYAAGHSVYTGPQHIPVIGANGVPVDEPAVQQARAEHAAAHVKAAVHSSDVATPVVPADTVEVAAAKAAHYAAHTEVTARNGLYYHYAPLVHYRKRRGVVAYAAPFAYAHYAGAQHLPVIGANGVPVDEPAVQVARAAHAAHHVEAAARNGDVAVVAAHYATPVVYAAHHVATPVVAHANGAVVPADTVEVAAAKAAHFAAHAEAKVRNGDVHHYVAY